MNLQQLRYASEVARRKLSVSDAAAALHTSQPGVSKQIQSLEQELGALIFVRQGRRLTSITEAGAEILRTVERILGDIGNLKRIGAEFSDPSKGSLAVAVTHTQARYSMPSAVTAFKKRFPGVKLKLLQGNPQQLARMVIDGEADVAIATEALNDYRELTSVPCFQWHHGVVIPMRHPLGKARPLTLEAIAAYPLVTYDRTFTGRTSVDATFARRSLAPEVAMTALDSDVIKSYVSLGLGVGIIASFAFDRTKDAGLKMLEASHLFPAQTTRLAFRKGSYLRGYTVEFARLFAPHLAPGAMKQLEAAAESFSI
jgi:LysR family transcriptional regulator, cys regulon transcriptional activator